jgi:hypothetical protein
MIRWVSLCVVVVILVACGDEAVDLNATATRSVELTHVAEALSAATAVPTLKPSPHPPPTATATVAATATATPTIPATNTPRPTPIPITIVDMFPLGNELPQGMAVYQEEHVSRDSIYGRSGFVTGLRRDYDGGLTSSGDHFVLTIVCAEYETNGAASSAMFTISSDVATKVPTLTLSETTLSRPVGQSWVAMAGTVDDRGSKLPVAFLWFQAWKYMCQYSGISTNQPPTDEIVALAAAAYASGPAGPAPTATALPSGRVEVEYLVTTTGSGINASLTWANATGGTEQHTSYVLPWNKVQSMRPGDFVYISAQNNTQWQATITCEIKVNGQTIKRSTSSGGYAVVTCSGTVPG